MSANDNFGTYEWIVRMIENMREELTPEESAPIGYQETLLMVLKKLYEHRELL